MSLMGIDIGSSSVKVAAYREDGGLIGVARGEATPRHPEPGWWEQDAQELWVKTSELVQAVATQEPLRHDPPKAIAISASARENFPADAEGNPLGPCIMAGDLRGAEFEVLPAGAPDVEPWMLSCGHKRERMDPVNRLLFWRKYYPDTMAKARWFLGWHEFLSLRLCGRAALDRSIAGRWLVYDIARSGWSPERLGKFGIETDLLPELLPWGSIIGEIREKPAIAWGLPAGVKLAVGTSDLNGAALGTGVSEEGTSCLASGSFENQLIPASRLLTGGMLLRGFTMTPHPGKSGLSFWAICPTGTMVLNWARNLLRVSIEDLDQELQKASPGPSPVVAVPYLSGALLHWPDGRRLRGGLLGLTLATSPIDIVKALMESIAYDHVATIRGLREEGVDVDRIRATGGGSRSTWWTQLKADLMGIPIEVASEPEPATLGAALLAGLALGVYRDIEQAGDAVQRTSRVHDPNPERLRLHEDRINALHGVVPALMESLYRGDGS